MTKTETKLHYPWHALLQSATISLSPKGDLSLLHQTRVVHSSNHRMAMDSICFIYNLSGHSRWKYLQAIDNILHRPVLQAEHPVPSTHSSLDLAVLNHPIFLINTQNRLQCAKVSEPHTMSQEWFEECRAQQLSIQLYIHVAFGKANACRDSFEAYC